MRRMLSEKQNGIALFISILMTMSLSIIALVTMARLSETAHTTGKSLEDKKLLAYAHSAVNIVNGELRQLVDSTFECADAYSITGGTGGNAAYTNSGTFKYYPRDITVTTGGERPLFAYRAAARRLTTDKDAKIYGINSTAGAFDKNKNACYDVTVDVREVVDLGSGANITKDSATSAPGSSNARYALGKMKTIGLVSCFSRNGQNE